MRKPQSYISALTGGQRHDRATLAWLQGGLPWRGESGVGRLIVVDTRIDGKIERYASRKLPEGWLDCRLWLEEAPDTIQAVASCPGGGTVRLTAAGQSIPGLGPDNKPASLYDVMPLTAVEPERIVTKIHRRDYAPAHPSLFLLGLLAMAPLMYLALEDLKKARKLRGKAAFEGVMEQTDKGTLTIRNGERRVTVFVEQGEVISVGLGGAARGGDAMAVEGLRAAVQGLPEELDHQQGEAFRGGETLRLRGRLLSAAGLHVGVATVGVALAALVAMGLGF
jgi:hypothetical protein